MGALRRLFSRGMSRNLFDARWIMAPFYFGLVIALVLLLWVFLRELVEHLLRIAALGPVDAVLLALALIDLSLIANLLLIVILAGYENFVARIESGHERRPAWMGTVDFTGMKMKLMGSITAISAIALLRIFMKLEEGKPVDPEVLRWMAILHCVLLLSAVVLAVTDRLGRVPAPAVEEPSERPGAPPQPPPPRR